MFRERSSAGGIVAKKRDPGILDPELFLAQIRKVEARLGKLAKIRKVETDSLGKLGNFFAKLGKLRKIWKKIAKLGNFCRIRKVH